MINFENSPARDMKERCLGKIEEALKLLAEEREQRGGILNQAECGYFEQILRRMEREVRTGRFSGYDYSADLGCAIDWPEWPPSQLATALIGALDAFESLSKR